MKNAPPKVPASTKGSIFYRLPAPVIGFIMTVVSGALVFLQGNGLDDGLQWKEIVAIVAPALTGILTYFKVYSQAAVDQIVKAPEHSRQKVRGDLPR